ARHLYLDRSKARRASRRGIVRLVEPVGCLWRESLWTKCRLDRAGDPRSHGAGLRRKLCRSPAHDVQGAPHANGRTWRQTGLSYSRAFGIARSYCPFMSLESVRAFFAENAQTSP